MKVSMVMGAGGEQGNTPLSENPIQTRISSTQDAMLRDSQGKVEVYGGSIDFGIPTISERTSYLLHQLMGSRTEAMILSPTGGIAEERFYKPVSQLRVDRSRNGSFLGEGPNQAKSTDEETLRFWLLGNPEFREELARLGWMVFPEVTQVDEYERKRLGIQSEHVYQRAFSIADLVRTISLTDHDGVDYSLLLKDLQELGTFAQVMKYVYQTSVTGDAYFFLDLKYRDAGFRLKVGDRLGSVEDLGSVVIGRTRTPNTMRRRVLFDVYEGLGELDKPDRGRASTLILEYLETNFGKRFAYAGTGIREKKELEVEIASRGYDEEVLEPKTGKLLDELLELRKFKERVIEVTTQRQKHQEGIALDEMRREVGIPLKGITETGSA